MTKDIYLTDEQYLKALKRFREAIANGIDLEYFDDNSPGDKDLQCTWGLCSRKKEMWRDKETHMWPNDSRDRNSPYIYGIKYQSKHQLCPMDTREKGSGNGCFYTCRVFQAKSKKDIPTREETLELYDLKIKYAEGLIK